MRHGKRPARASEAGFTLVELVVALALLGLLTILLYDGLRLGRDAWQRAQTSESGANLVRAVQEELRGYLARAAATVVESGPGGAETAFEGRSGGVTFLTPVAGVGPAGGLARVRLYFEAVENGGALKMSSRPERGTGPETESVLLAGLETVEFGYFGPPQRGRPLQWLNDWTGRLGLPHLIRIRAQPSTDTTSWPELIVATRIDADTNCTFDPLIRFCRGY